MKRCLRNGLALLAAVHWVSTLSQAAVLWQIGNPDESSGEFSHWRDRRTGQRRLDYADPTQDPVFVIERNQPTRDWFSFQPGTANGAAGYRAHPFTIEFDLDHEPRGLYRLRLDLLAYSARLPHLEIVLNDRAGTYYQQPSLTYTGGDQAVFYLPHYAKSVIEAEFTADTLRRGKNRLVLTAIDDPNERDDAQPSGFTWPGVSGIVYDALRFDHLPDQNDTSIPPSLQLEPTIFYRRENGPLLEELQARVRLLRWPKTGQLTLRLHGKDYRLALPANRAHGEARLSVHVPEFTPGTIAEAVLNLDEGERRFSIALTPARKWHLLLVPSEHLDVGYTDYAHKIAELQSRTVDQALDLIDRHPEFRFTLDGFWIAEQFLRGRAPEQQKRFLERVRDGSLSLPGVYASPFTGFASLENLIRGLYPSHRFAQAQGVPCNFALITDVPSYSWSYASVLAAAGIEQFVAASDAYRAPFLLYNRLHEQGPLWWVGPDGGRVLVWYSRHYHQGASLFGMPPRLESARESIPRLLQAYDRPAYRSDAVILYGTQVENVALFPQQASFASLWNQHHAFPRLEYSTFPKALARIAADQGDAIPTHRGDGGPYWEDGLGANARITSLARINMRRALSAEVFSSAAEVVNPAFRPDKLLRDQLWENLLLADEHTWHADVSTSDPESQQSRRQGADKNARTEDARRTIDHLLGRAVASLSEAIPNPAGTVVVFNSLNWVRSGFVELDIPTRTAPVDLATGTSVPHETLHSGNAFRHVRFLAQDVPAVGYRSYSLRPVPGPAPAPATNHSAVLENRFYRLELDPASGGIRSLLDRELGRELVDRNHAFRLNQHLYVTGADTLPNRLIQFSTVAPPPELTVHAAGGGRLIGVWEHGFGTVARLESTNVNHPRIETTVILHAHEKKIELINRVEKLQVYAKEAAYFAFPFATSTPRFRYALQNGFVDPARDLLPGACREWFCIQDWVAIEDTGANILWTPVDAPLITLGDIARGVWPREFGARPGTVFSYVMNNYTPEGYQAGQGGEFVFRYVLTSQPAFAATAAARFGAAALTPLEANEITRNDKVQPARGPLEPALGAFLSVSASNLNLVTWKRAEDNDDMVLRLVETQGSAGSTEISSPLWAIEEAWQANALETKQRPARVEGQAARLDFTPFQILTLRVRAKPAR